MHVSAFWCSCSIFNVNQTLHITNYYKELHLHKFTVTCAKILAWKTRNKIYFKMFQKKKSYNPNFTNTDYTSYLIKALQITSMWPLPGSNKNKLVKFLSNLYIIFFHTTLLHMVYVLMMDTKKEMSKGLQAITFHLANIVAYIMACLMALYFQVYSRQIQQFIADLNKSMRNRSAIGFDYVTAEKNFRIVRLVAISWNFIGLTGKWVNFR